MAVLVILLFRRWVLIVVVNVFVIVWGIIVWRN
jgi:hypothetical protein